MVAQRLLGDRVALLEQLLGVGPLRSTRCSRPRKALASSVDPSACTVRAASRSQR
ncbi:hypothetical protein [Lentzea sp. NPDC003310]|uniref:hypothetical protein n=1 Tax=Lentzea sp. NPDC003310 TaxID=3154447 RepID=UPI0033B58142